MESTTRNYNTISPSAKSLLLMKGYTNIPYAREAAKLLMKPENYEPDFQKKTTGFWARVIHFEDRYWSINQLLADAPAKNILELSSGFSFRGLDMISKKDCYYIDTDLPDVIEMKKNFVAALQKEASETKGKLEILPLNALDEIKFSEIVSHFLPGEIIIVNEGLLMYLDKPEKKSYAGLFIKSWKNVADIG